MRDHVLGFAQAAVPVRLRLPAPLRSSMLNRVNPIHGVHHIALKSTEPDRLAAFYRETLGLNEATRHVDEAGLRSVWLKLGGDGALLMIERSGTPGEAPGFCQDPPGFHLLALRIRAQDRTEWAAHLAEWGHPVRSASRYSLYFADPEGHRFALSHFPDSVPDHP